MKPIKKSINISGDLAQLADEFIQRNPGVNFTLMVNSALKEWLKNPKIKINQIPLTEDDVDNMIQNDKALMESLAK